MNARELNVVTRPADLAGASLRELLDGYETHRGPLVTAHLGIGTPKSPWRLRDAALGMLVCGQALAGHILAMRWVTVAEALSYGAPLEDVAAAMGLQPDEVAAGLRSWAGGQLREQRMTPAAHDDVVALVEGVQR
jgi:hypothetical protein